MDAIRRYFVRGRHRVHRHNGFCWDCAILAIAGMEIRTVAEIVKSK